MRSPLKLALGGQAPKTKSMVSPPTSKYICHSSVGQSMPHTEPWGRLGRHPWGYRLAATVGELKDGPPENLAAAGSFLCSVRPAWAETSRSGAGAVGPTLQVSAARPGAKGIPQSQAHTCSHTHGTPPP